MNLVAMNERVEQWRQGAVRARRRGRHVWTRIALFLAVLGPGVITSTVDNDAGGISTYSVAGARFGYLLLWSLVPMAIILYITEEMCARMAVVTGKGLSDLIREEFGFRATFFVMLCGLVVNLGNIVAEFAGIAAAMEIMHVSRYIAVPIAGLVVWTLVLQGTHRQVERIFLALCSFYLAYFFSALLAKPDWLAVAQSTVVPVMHFNAGYLLMLTGLVGATVAPWQFFYIQAGFVERRVGPRHYGQARADVIAGVVSSILIVFFIMVCTAATLYVSGHREITGAADAARALAPLAGRFAELLFAFGLLNASLLAASILPLSTAQVICEGLGFEAGIDRKFREAPIFYWLYGILIIVGGGLILIPGAPLFRILVLSQVANGIWLPVVLIFMIKLINRRDLMGDKVNSATFNAVAWFTTVAMIVLTLVLIYAGVFRPGAAPVPGL
jgi:NRAMP (natural resistance-associated macrophage protein)-like metal ion transporter